MYAAAAETWGQAIDVPEIMLNGTHLLSPLFWETGEAKDHAATISTPGADKSGCNYYPQKFRKLGIRLRLSLLLPYFISSPRA